VLEAASLEELSKLAAKCCKKRPSKKDKSAPRVPPKPPRSGPPIDWVLEFDRLPISQNKTTYSPWYVHHNDKRDWLRRISLSAYKLGGTFLYSSWRVERHYGGRNKEFDHANLVGGLKGFFDSLVQLGVIQDDAPTFFKADYVQFPATKSFTRLVLLEYQLAADQPRVQNPSQG